MWSRVLVLVSLLTLIGCSTMTPTPETPQAPLKATAITPAGPSWRIVLEGQGAPPTGSITVNPGDPTPPTPPAPTPPAPPTPTPPPAEDITPFQWPAQPQIPSNDPAARYTPLGVDPNWKHMDFYTYYRALPIYANPLPISHGFACFYPGQDGERVWAPKNGTPSAIRRVCAGGKP